MDLKQLQMIDVRDPKEVEITFSADRTKLWINVEGVCFLRVQSSSAKPLKVALDGFEEFEP